jgi:hypothetical protein
MKILKTILSILAIPFGVKNKLTDEMVDENVCDFSGQGKNKYGK